jgi:phosphatidylethanolamine/phosphatidyl-N-methylethanolamine N-methyltransferase
MWDSALWWILVGHEPKSRILDDEDGARSDVGRATDLTASGSTIMVADIRECSEIRSPMATNRGLLRAYTIWATIYDPLTRFLRWSRRRSIGLLDLRPSDRILIVGCGTGADFEFLPREAQCAAVDLTPAMLRRAAAKIGDRRIRLEEMDAMDLRFPNNTFDKAILHLILAVVPDPVRALQETERVTKPGALLVVLDKFWNRPSRPPLLLRVANAICGGYVTAVDRNFHSILAATSLEILREIPLGFGGLYFLYLLRKPSPLAQ